jgi:hypothetical protein
VNEGQRIVVSNGLSRRRRVLKRPIVCKSQDKGVCGDCLLTIDPAEITVPTLGHFTFQVQMACDPDPMDVHFALEMEGVFKPDEPAPTIQANDMVDWGATAPAANGIYLMTLQARNAGNCRFRQSIPVTVFTT